MDETSMKVKGQWHYLYCAVDKHGQTIDFRLTEHRDTEAALRFLKKASRHNGLPESLTIDGSDANAAAIQRHNEAHGTAIAIRQVKYLHNIVEQDHRAVKRVTRPMLGFQSFDAAHDTLVGIELMHMIKKRQMVVEAGEEGLTAAEVFYSLAASSPPRQEPLPLHGSLSNICDRAFMPPQGTTRHVNGDRGAEIYKAAAARAVQENRAISYARLSFLFRAPPEWQRHGRSATPSNPYSR
jgi:hypothetical protein